MTEEQRKEAMSREFLRILAEGHGFKILNAAQDHGVDMGICPVSVREIAPGRVRYLDSQFKLDFQLKATTTAGIVETDEAVKYDLEAKTYNDLVFRKDEFLPLHLLVVVLPAAPPACISVEHDRLGLLGRAFWYLPDQNAEATENEHRIRITIPKSNQIGANFVRERFEDLGVEL